MNCCPSSFLPRLVSAGSNATRRCGLLTFILKQACLFGLVAVILPQDLKAAEVPDVKATNGVSALAGSPTNSFNILDDKYQLSIGDQLSLRIIEDEEDPVHLTVTDSGDLQVPYIGRYPAAGKTCKELALTLKVELEKEYYRVATVVVAVDSKPRSRGKIYIVGSIRAPGPQDLSSDEVLTVSKAILRAGSFTEFADQKNVRVTRGTGLGADAKKTFTVNVAQVFEKGKTENDLPLQPGDLIFIPERMIRF